MSTHVYIDTFTHNAYTQIYIHAYVSCLGGSDALTARTVVCVQRKTCTTTAAHARNLSRIVTGVTHKDVQHTPRLAFAHTAAVGSGAARGCRWEVAQQPAATHPHINGHTSMGTHQWEAAQQPADTHPPTESHDAHTVVPSAPQLF